MSKLRQLIEAANRKCEMAWKVYSYNPEKDNELVDTSKAFDCIAAAQAHKRDILEKNPNYTVEIIAEAIAKARIDIGNDDIDDAYMDVNYAISRDTNYKLKDFKKEAANIDVKNPGVLEVPDGKKVDELPQSHFEKLVDKKGYAEIIRALTNLEVWNKDKNKSLSSWASNMADKLKKKYRPESAQKNEEIDRNTLATIAKEVRSAFSNLASIKSGVGVDYSARLEDLTFKIAIEVPTEKLHDKLEDERMKLQKNLRLKYKDFFEKNNLKPWSFGILIEENPRYWHSIKSNADYYFESAQKSESKVNMPKLKNEIQAAVNKYFKDDKDLLEYVHIDTKKDKLGRDILEVRAELGYNDMVKLADHLDKIVTKYDRYAYFDQETSGIMTAVFESAQKNESLRDLNLELADDTNAIAASADKIRQRFEYRTLQNQSYDEKQAEKIYLEVRRELEKAKKMIDACYNKIG